MKNEDMKTKIIAFHLPQYHVISENNEWWGEGFTDWVNVKKATPLFKDHMQPKIPESENYYDMMDYQTRKWQNDLAKQYNIFGFCYYHYWFDGKLLLEKPLESILKEKDLEQHFCLCWANEPWCRTWEGGGGQVLIDQKYGEKEEWKKHFNYLLPFFKDCRYIRVNSKPLFVIYRSTNIENYEEMMVYWKELSKDSGLDGLFIVEENNSFQSEKIHACTDAMLDFEPMYTLQYKRSLLDKICQRLRSEILGFYNHNKLHYYNYDYIWNKILNRDQKNNQVQRYLGAFVNWDNTARKAKKGIVFEKASADKFGYYMQKQIAHAKRKNSEFIFINAWNEWAEGAYLEPDSINKSSYLSALKEAIKSEVGE